MKAPASYTKKGPGLAQLRRDLDRVEKSHVLVGIPADHTLREKEPINNASLLFVHTNGSELNHIPPRPVLEPSIEANQKTITPHLGAAAKAVFDHKPTAAENELNKAGLIAANGAKRWFTDPRNGWEPNAPSTIAAKGSDKPLIDTGQLRRSITYVVKTDAKEIVAPGGEVQGHSAASLGEMAETIGEALEDMAETFIP